MFHPDVASRQYCCVYSVETHDDGQYICPKHVRVLYQNELEKQCIALVFIIRIILKRLLISQLVMSFHAYYGT